MIVSSKSWDRYIKALKKLNNRATNRVLEKLSQIDIDDTEQMAEAINYAYGIATKYGEGAATLAAEMYDALAELSGQLIPAAVPASTATYGEVAKAMYGTRLQSKNPETIASSVRLLTATVL